MDDSEMTICRVKPDCTQIHNEGTLLEIAWAAYVEKTAAMENDPQPASLFSNQWKLIPQEPGKPPIWEPPTCEPPTCEPPTCSDNNCS